MICHGDELIFYSAQKVPSKASVKNYTTYLPSQTCPVQDDVPFTLSIEKSVLARKGKSAH